jgi:DnaJ-class molecular chaperone
MQHHPDHNAENTKEAEARFKEINEAYIVLSDEYKRWQYDRLISLSGYPRREAFADNIFSERGETDFMLEILQKITGSGSAISAIHHGRSWGCKRHRGWQCRQY